MRCCLTAAPALLTAAASASLRRRTASWRPPHPDAVAAVHLELVTLTEDSAVITWYTGVPGTDDGTGAMVPAPTEGEVAWGTHPARLDRTAYGDDGPTAHHHVELTGLEPGRTYYYRARSRGAVAVPTPLHLVGGNAVGTSPFGLGSGGPYAFTTPQPPPGSFLLAAALCNDLHLGETRAGLVAGVPLMRGVGQDAGLAPYPRIMGRALVEDARLRGADCLLAAGDLSAGGATADLGEAKRILDGFGGQGADWFAVPGNHDRAAAAGAGAGPFAPDGPGWFDHDLHGLRIMGLDTYDKPGNGGDAGGLSPEQLSWFRARLRDHADQPTVVFGHHPLAVPDSPFPVTGGQRLNRRQARALLDGYAAAPGVFLHHAGHTHRNKRSVLPAAPGVTFQEVGAVKEYPGGFCLLRVHTGGFALNFYKTRGAAARRWSERSRRVAAGLWPLFAFGRGVADRNSVTVRDLSGVRAPGRRRAAVTA